MKIGMMPKTAMCCALLLGSSLTCLASETPDTGHYAQKIQQEEAIVVRIDQNNVTLQSTGDKEKIVTAPFSNAADFKVGDKVIVIGNSLQPSGVNQGDRVRPVDAPPAEKAAPGGN
ncbi:MAG: hypothetical protein CXR30_10605 [Geobacter sp.]|nr:MAG: hypothetical protein CXR30_10605 [Geobacter sp.]